MKVIVVPSRRGGAGKTSVSMVAAGQLANSGKRVAYVELDTLGHSLAKSFPGSRDCFINSNGVPEWKTPTKEQSDSGRTSSLIREFYWSKTFEKESLNKVSSTIFLEGLKWSISSKDVSNSESMTQMVQDESDCNKQETWVKNLTLIPCSIEAQFIKEFQTSCLTVEGRADISTFLTSFILSLEDDNFDYVFLDMVPGFSYDPATVLYWFGAELGRDSKKEKKHIDRALWIISTSAWVETSLLAGQIRPYLAFMEDDVEIKFIWNYASPNWHLKIKEFDEGQGTFWKKNIVLLMLTGAAEDRSKILADGFSRVTPISIRECKNMRKAWYGIEYTQEPEIIKAEDGQREFLVSQLRGKLASHSARVLYELSQVDFLESDKCRSVFSEDIFDMLVKIELQGAV